MQIMQQDTHTRNEAGSRSIPLPPSHGPLPLLVWLLLLLVDLGVGLGVSAALGHGDHVALNGSLHGGLGIVVDLASLVDVGLGLGSGDGPGGVVADVLLVLLFLPGVVVVLVDGVGGHGGGAAGGLVLDVGALGHGLRDGVGLGSEGSRDGVPARVGGRGALPLVGLDGVAAAQKKQSDGAGSHVEAFARRHVVGVGTAWGSVCASGGFGVCGVGARRSDFGFCEGVAGRARISTSGRCAAPSSV